MLLELHARDLGVIADLTLVFAPGMTALTGETGAGKTLVVEAIELLLGGRSDPLLVRPGAGEARVEGRFVAAGHAAVAGNADRHRDGDGDGDGERILSRVVPATGRSRAYVDGRLATAGELAEIGRTLVDLHGQHAHQSLLAARTQRAALDRFGGVDLAPLIDARRRLDAVDEALAALGGDERARARELDLLRYQLDEIGAAGIAGPDEEDELEREEDLLAGAEAHRDAGEGAYRSLTEDDALGRAIAALTHHRPFEALAERSRALAAELADLASDLRHATEAVVVDPERLDTVRGRRRMLGGLRRKYGERLSDVLAFESQAKARLAELEHHGERARALEAERAMIAGEAAREAAAVAAARRRAAPGLASAVEERLRTLAMGGARFEVAVDGADPADEVTFLLGANPGEAALPLARVASGGELARAMLALRLVLGAGDDEAPGTLIFDEVDAGIGGRAALAVGQALAALDTPQVLVVTHLPQVAAFADHQVAVTKQERDGRTVAHARTLTDEDRVVELSRMLSGQPASATARDHAQELLAAAAASKGGTGAR